MHNTFRYAFGFIFTVMLLAIILLFTTVVKNPEGYVYYLRPGMSKFEVISELHKLGILRLDQEVALGIIALPGKKTALKTGEYHFKKGATLRSVWYQMKTGTGLYYRHLTIIPGWTFKQVRTALLKASVLRQLTASLDDKQLMDKLGHADLLPEGQFFPDTYNYTRGDTDVTVLKVAFDRMQKKLQQVWNNRSAGLPYKNAYEALIVASIIEREAYLDMERPVIAGVFMNRLASNMPLQVDATVIYGLGDRYTGKIYKENLLEDTPFNTYLHRGLPPTPISMPGFASLEAATHPERNPFYYYVTKGKGAHEFSATLNAHHAAVEAQKKQGI